VISLRKAVSKGFSPAADVATSIPPRSRVVPQPGYSSAVMLEVVMAGMNKSGNSPSSVGGGWGGHLGSRVVLRIAGSALYGVGCAHLIELVANDCPGRMISM